MSAGCRGGAANRLRHEGRGAFSHDYIWNIPDQAIRWFRETPCFMPTNRTLVEWEKGCHAGNSRARSGNYLPSQLPSATSTTAGLLTERRSPPIGSQISINLPCYSLCYRSLFQPPVYHTARVHFGISGRSENSICWYLDAIGVNDHAILRPINPGADCVSYASVIHQTILRPFGSYASCD